MRNEVIRVIRISPITRKKR